jgi:transposase-like protein
MFKRRRFPVEIILLCVRWYCKYGISDCRVRNYLGSGALLVK